MGVPEGGAARPRYAVWTGARHAQSRNCAGKIVSGNQCFFQCVQHRFTRRCMQNCIFPLSIHTIFNPSFTSLSPAGQFEDAYSSYTSALN